MKMLITGGAGFIGSHLAEKLLEKKHKVLIIDNFTTGRKDNLPKNRDLQIVENTIVDDKLVDKIFDKFRPDKVVHAAASYKNPDNWIEDAETNVIGTINIVKAAEKYKIKRIIYFQTSLCYGLKPLEELITLKHPLFSGGYSGGSSYAISKTAAEQYIALSTLDFISFRLANAYGPRNLSGPLPTFYQRLTTGKECFIMDTRRDFIYIDDLIEVVLKALNGKGKKGYYHISSGRDYSVKELFNAVIKALNIRLEKNAKVKKRSIDDVFTIMIDPSKTNKEFNWKTHTPLETGVRNAVNWYKEHEMSETFTHLKLGRKNT